MKVINLQYYNPKKYRLLKDGIQILERDDVGSLTHFLSELMDFGIDLQAYDLLDKELNRVGKLPISISYNGSIWTIEKVEDKIMRDNKSVYIAGMPEAVKDNRTRMQELGNLIREGGYSVAGRPGKEPWQMTKEEFAKTTVPLPDRKDFIKAWLKDNEDIPDLVKPGFNYIEQRNGSLLVFGNQGGQAIGIISFRKDAVEHIAVSDRYKSRGIATQLLEESRKYGVRRIYGQISPEVAGIAHRFMVKTAFLENKPVPTHILREYPDLMAKAEKQKWRYR